MGKPEVILNLWYIHDSDGLIFSLRVRAYVGIGTDEEKVALLQRFAERDYLIARPFPIPQRFYLEVGKGKHVQRLPVAHTMMLQELGSPISLFEDAIEQVQAGLPAQSDLFVPPDPITCVTPLLGDESGRIAPVYSKRTRFDPK